MLRQDIKDIYFLANRWLTIPNHYLAKTTYAFRRDEKPLYLHLGCGDTYVPGMVNIDGNFRRKKELWLDLRNGLPFKSNTALFVYCCHTIEHLYPSDAIRILSEVRRVLKPGSCARIAVPSFEHILQIMDRKARSIWPASFESAEAQAVNYLFCDGQHKYGYSSEILQNFSAEAGFTDIRDVSNDPPRDYFGLHLEEEPEGSLVFELYA